MKGTLVVWSQTRNFGFIQPDATTEISDRLFVHLTNFDGDRTNVRLGIRVEFSIGDPISIGKKPQAVHVKFLAVETEISAGANALKAGL